MDTAPFPNWPPLPSLGGFTATPQNFSVPRLDLFGAPPSGVSAPPNGTPVAPPPKPPEVLIAWPRCAQLAAAFLLGGLTVLLGVHALTYLRQGAEPSKIDAALPIAYRVDLNAARRAELLQLPGVGPNLADRIEQNRRASGGFRSVDDLLKVQGIGPTTLERMRPFVSVKAGEKGPVQVAAARTSKPTKSAGNKQAALLELIDVNHATLTELQKLPGIGPKMSQRIVDERDKRLFTSVADLRRVSGIGPKILEKLKPYVTVK